MFAEPKHAVTETGLNPDRTRPTNRPSAPATRLSIVAPALLAGLEDSQVKSEFAPNENRPPFSAQAPNGSGGKQYAGRQATHPQLSRPAGLPFSFAIPQGQFAIGSPEEQAVYQAQLKFAKELNSLPDADPASPEYAAQWDKSAAIHDNQLRLFLGGPRYVQLSALAMQAEQAARKD